MAPALQPGQVLIAGWFVHLNVGDIVVINHDGLEKIKRIAAIDNGQLYVLGDNAQYSTDSRQYGWIRRELIVAIIWWPRC